MKNRIQELRDTYEITQSYLAKHIGVPQDVLSSWERGETNADNESLKKIALFFNVTTDYLLGLNRED